MNGILKVIFNFGGDFEPCFDLPILAFLVFLAFFRFAVFLDFLCVSALSLSFLSLFFGKKARKTTPKTRIFYPRRTPKIPGKEGKNAQKNKEILKKRGKTRNSKKKQGKEGQGFPRISRVIQRGKSLFFSGDPRFWSKQARIGGSGLVKKSPARLFCLSFS